MDNFSENYQLCQLGRDDSWPLQDPDLADPFNSPSQDFDLSVDLDASMEWAHPWHKTNISPVPECSWEQLANNLKSSTLNEEGTSLTPILAALDVPKTPVLPDELDSSALGSCSPDGFAQSEGFVQRRGGYPPKLGENRFQYSDYRQYGELGSGTYVVQPTGGDMVTIGIYTRAERAAKIRRFRQKRERRNFTKRVLYGCRKQFADSRPRVGGRFVINENRVIKPKIFLKRGRPRKVPLLPIINCLPASFLSN